MIIVNNFILKNTGDDLMEMVCVILPYHLLLSCRVR